MERKIKVLLAKPGLDGHDRGVLVVARALRDAGMEVVYTGLRQSPEQIAEAALQEDVEVVGISSLSGAHGQLIPEVVRALRERGLEQVLVVAGGVIPHQDIAQLEAAGVRRVFGPGTPTGDIIDFIRRGVRPAW
jgi:methylmalonyl-CoA mutase C-terminal domain/subunit